MVAAASLQGRQLQRKVIGTFVFVFMTFLVRSVFTCLFAVAQALQNTGDNVHSNIQGWIVYTPAFQMVTTLIASPIALLVALWGMSGVGALEQMSSSSVQTQLSMNSRAALRQTKLQMMQRLYACAWVPASAGAHYVNVCICAMCGCAIKFFNATITS